MKNRIRTLSSGLHDVLVPMRRYLTAFLCASLILSLAPQAFAGGDKGYRGSEGRDRDGDDGKGTGDRGETKTGRDRRTDIGNTVSGDGDRMRSRPQRAKDSDQEKAREAVAEGQFLPLKDVLDRIDRDRYGIVIAIDLKRQGDSDIYRMRTRDSAGVIRDLRIDARTGKFLNVLGF